MFLITTCLIRCLKNQTSIIFLFFLKEVMMSTEQVCLFGAAFDTHLTSCLQQTETGHALHCS